MRISPSHPNLEKLITGQASFNFENATAGMLFFNLQRKYKKNATSLPALKLEALEFFKKYEKFMQNDLNKIFK